jgi:hypothetical protein
MRTNKFVFACLNCGRDTQCVNRLICDECRHGAAGPRTVGHQRFNSLAGKAIARVRKQSTARVHRASTQTR